MDTGLIYPEDVVNVGNGGGSINWSSVANAVDGNDATAAVCSVIDYENTSFLKCTDLLAPVPGGATITGVEVEILSKGDGTYFNVLEGPFKLVVGGSIVGTQQNGPGNMHDTPFLITRGSSSNLWGLSSISPAEANASNFGVAIAYNCNDVYAGSNLSIYSVRMRLYYTAPESLSRMFLPFYH